MSPGGFRPHPISWLPCQPHSGKREPGPAPMLSNLGQLLPPRGSWAPLALGPLLLCPGVQRAGTGEPARPDLPCLAPFPSTSVPQTPSGQEHGGRGQRPASASEADSITDGGYTHSAQPGPGLGRGPSCQVSSGTGILVSRKPSPGRGVRGPPSRTSSGFLCTVSTGGRRGENRGQNRHSCGPSGQAPTQDTRGSRTR